ncbi:hypothetical protein TNCV_590751 [Trichonephila clavipes]|nr:hypothetical protein TNCV_590751 [Trichonephila clavipes]
MVEGKRSAGAEKIYALKDVNYLTVEVVPFHKFNKTSPRFKLPFTISIATGPLSKSESPIALTGTEGFSGGRSAATPPDQLHRR